VYHWAQILYFKTFICFARRVIQLCGKYFGWYFYFYCVLYNPVMFHITWRRFRIPFWIFSSIFVAERREAHVRFQWLRVENWIPNSKLWDTRYKFVSSGRRRRQQQHLRQQQQQHTSNFGRPLPRRERVRGNEPSPGFSERVGERRADEPTPATHSNRDFRRFSLAQLPFSGAAKLLMLLVSPIKVDKKNILNILQILQIFILN